MTKKKKQLFVWADKDILQPMGNMNIDKAIKEWESKERTMGCNNATLWFVTRVRGFYPEQLSRWTKNDKIGYGHYIATDGKIRIDLAPYADKPEDY